MSEHTRVRLITFYLPQFHPIPENDAWWGPGFTEWTNVARARPLFRGHDQPRIPADLGFYDLRLPETRLAQAELARTHGVHGFCYYHYWFSGRRVLERPFDEVLASGTPRLPFCLCWANEDWTRAWDGASGQQLLRQHYSDDDDRAHMTWLAHALSDERAIRIDGRPLLLIYQARKMPDPARTLRVWRETARALGLGELYLCRVEGLPDERGDPRPLGFDAAVEFAPDWTLLGRPLRRDPLRRALYKLGLNRSAYQRHRIFGYADLAARMLAKPRPPYPRFPCVTPRWDNSPRRKANATIFVGDSPALYRHWLEATVRRFEPPSPQENLVFVNAWNEWAEGAYLEPDRRWGRQYLEATRDALGSFSQ
jgi:lipopolysaccharide biosynthesis protein